MIMRLIASIMFLLLIAAGQSVFAQDNTLRGIANKEMAIAMKSMQDSDFDGRIDRWEYYDENDVLVRIEEDTNHDGQVDQWSEVRDGKITKREKDTDLDGKPDQTIEY